MPLFRRRRDREPEPEPPPPGGVPEWASFMAPDEFAAFTATVARVLDDLGVPSAWGDGAVAARVGDGEVTFGLGNIAQISHAAEPADREAVVRAHLTRLVEMQREDPAEPPDFATVAPLLKLRVWAHDDLPPEFPFVARPFAEHLVAVLSIDWPEQVSTVSAEDADAWGRSHGELWELAADNTRADPDVDIEVLTPSDGGLPLTTCVGDSFFASSRALWPDELVAGDVPPDGLVVAIPNRHLALVLPIVDLRVVEAISWLASFVRDRHVEGPGSISSDLYWWRAGEWTRLPVQALDDRVQFFPPDEFVEVMNRLAEPDG